MVNQNGSRTFTEKFSKTEDARTIPVPTPVMDMLVSHIDRYVDTAYREAFLFLAPTGSYLLRGNFRRDVLRRGADRAGLGDRGIHWLTLRHTGASLMFDAGLTLFEVQQRLGHKDPTMTARVYTHLMRERFEEGRTKMEHYMTRMRPGGSLGSREAQ